MGIFSRLIDLYHQGLEPGDYAPEDDLMDPVAFSAPHLLTASPYLRGGRISWDAVLKGVPKVKYIPGWEFRGNPVMTPVANLWHWTAGKPTAARPAPSLNLCINGRPDVSGPLVHGLIGLDGTIHIIASGRANHAGMGHKELLVDIKAGRPPKGLAVVLRLADTGGSGGYLTGWEIENDGKAPLSNAQIISIGNICKATRLRLGYNLAQAAQWHHAAWTKRKVDLDPAKMQIILAQASRP